jgi:hypothetical protein
MVVENLPKIIYNIDDSSTRMPIAMAVAGSACRNRRHLAARQFFNPLAPRS